MQENQDKKRDSFLPSGAPGILPVVTAIAGIFLLYFWLSADAAQNLTLRLPSEQDFIESDEGGGGIIKGELVRFDGEPADAAGLHQHVQPRLGRRAGHAGGLGQFRDRHARVPAQRGKDLAIGRWQVGHVAKRTPGLSKWSNS